MLRCFSPRLYPKAAANRHTVTWLTCMSIDIHTVYVDWYCILYVICLTVCQSRYIKACISIDIYISIDIQYPIDHIWATSWQNRQNGMCAQPRLSSGHLASLIRVFAFRMKKAWVLSYPLNASEDSDQTGRMPRLIWVFAGCTVILWFCHEAAHIYLHWHTICSQPYISIAILYVDQHIRYCMLIGIWAEGWTQVLLFDITNMKKVL